MENRNLRKEGMVVLPSKKREKPIVVSE